ncbi:MAG: hypothetical protein U1E65_08625 [Myxococcota bacterium]
MLRRSILLVLPALFACRTLPERESKVIVPGDGHAQATVLYGLAKKKCPTADMPVPDIAVTLKADQSVANAVSGKDGHFWFELDKVLQEAPKRSLHVGAQDFEIPAGLTFTIELIYPCEGDGPPRLAIAEPATAPRNPRYPVVEPMPDQPIQRPDPIDPTSPR